MHSGWEIFATLGELQRTHYDAAALRFLIPG